MNTVISLDIEQAVMKRARLLQNNAKLISESVVKIAELVSNCLHAGNKLMFCGNGGSAAEAQHMSAEYCATLDHRRPRSGFASLALTTDTSFVTAWSNDFGYSGIFLRQVETLGKMGDLLFVYTTSGNSENVCLAAEYAVSNGMVVVALTGDSNETRIERSSTYTFKAPATETPLIQEIHTIVGHEVCATVEKKLLLAS